MEQATGSAERDLPVPIAASVWTGIPGPGHRLLFLGRPLEAWLFSDKKLVIQV